jgi:UDP-2,3-diacylglucosamine hydrolase
MRDASQEATAEKSNAITDVNPAAVHDFLHEHTPDLFIHGHTHRPNIHNIELENIAVKRIVLGDWGKTGWYLALNSKNIDLQEFNI